MPSLWKEEDLRSREGGSHGTGREEKTYSLYEGRGEDLFIWGGSYQTIMERSVRKEFPSLIATL